MANDAFRVGRPLPPMSPAQAAASDTFDKMRLEMVQLHQLVEQQAQAIDELETAIIELREAYNTSITAATRHS